MTNKNNEQVESEVSKTTSVLHKRALALAQRRTEKSEKISIRYALVFSIGEERYALELSKLKEVLPFTNNAPVPKSDRTICGIINIRGELHCVLDLGRLMGLETIEADDRGYVIILKENGVGFRINQLDQILSYKDNEIIERKNDEYTDSTKFTQSILKGNIILLDDTKILSHPIFAKETAGNNN